MVYSIKEKKERARMARKRYYKKNKKVMIAKNKLLYHTDPKYNAMRKKSNARNHQKYKSRYNKNQMAYQRKIYKVNIPYTLANICKARIHDSLKLQGAERFYSFSELIGCSWVELQKYLESKFEPGMKWKHNTHQKDHKFKAWHMDHIRPISSFDLHLAQNQKKAFNYKNIQPLFVTKHIKKSVNYLGKLEIKIRRVERENREYKKVLKKFI